MSALIQNNVEDLVRVSKAKNPKTALRQCGRPVIKAIAEIVLNIGLLNGVRLTKRDLEKVKPLGLKRLSLIKKRQIVLAHPKLFQRLVVAALKFINGQEDGPSARELAS